MSHNEAISDWDFDDIESALACEGVSVSDALQFGISDINAILTLPRLHGSMDNHDEALANTGTRKS